MPQHLFTFTYFFQKVTANPSGSKEVLIQTVLDYIKRTDQNSSVSLQPPSSTTYVEGNTTSKVSIQVCIGAHIYIFSK